MDRRCFILRSGKAHSRSRICNEDEKQQGLGKRLYEDREVKPNFDFREELDKRAERKARYGNVGQRHGAE